MKELAELYKNEHYPLVKSTLEKEIKIVVPPMDEKREESLSKESQEYKVNTSVEIILAELNKPRKKRVQWTKEEDAKFVEAVKKFGDRGNIFYIF